jgi:hypothetical protein
VSTNLALIVGAVLAVIGLLVWVARLGARSQAARQAEAIVDADQRISQAEAMAPADPADLAQRLRNAGQL